MHHFNAIKTPIKHRAFPRTKTCTEPILPMLIFLPLSAAAAIDHIKNPPPPFLCTKKLWAAGFGGDKVKEERQAMLPDAERGTRTLWFLGSLKSGYREAAPPSEVWGIGGESRKDTGWYSCYPNSRQLLSAFQGPENSREPWTLLMSKALGQ